MLIKALRLSQDVDLADASVTNFLVMQLPGGEVIKALVSDESVEKLTRAMSAMGVGDPMTEAAMLATFARTEAAPLARPEPPEDDEPVGAVIFGGGAPGQLPSQEPPPPPPVRPPSRIVTVATDDMGYPIVRHKNGVDPRDVIGGDGAPGAKDEDGVGQA